MAPRTHLDIRVSPAQFGIYHHQSDRPVRYECQADEEGYTGDKARLVHGIRKASSISKVLGSWGGRERHMAFDVAP
jgi:hypothetical protein